MTDDLTDQLRGRVHEACGGKHPCLTCQVILNAADRIKELEAAIAEHLWVELKDTDG